MFVELVLCMYCTVDIVRIWMVTTDFSPTLQCGVPRSGLMGGGVVNPEFNPGQEVRGAIDRVWFC